MKSKSEIFLLAAAVMILFLVGVDFTRKATAAVKAKVDNGSASLFAVLK